MGWQDWDNAHPTRDMSRRIPAKTIVSRNDGVQDGLKVSGEEVSILNGGQGHIGRHVPGQLLVPLVQKLDCHRDGQLHYSLLVVVEEDAAHNVAGHLCVGRVAFARGT